ncbi:MAG: AAA family ATPase, partial [Rhodospirillales bacterium]|nr:AAA family ATPase [Rhodospirillales bacterium]
PQLHTHCVLANMTRNAAGEWRSVEPTAIRRSEKLIGAHYRNELAMRLQAMGMAVTPRMIGPVPGFELAGYDKSFLDAFSGRRAEILKYLEEHDLPYNARNAETAALRTRAAKKEMGLSELVPEWRARARQMGLSRDKAVLRPARPVDPVTGKQVPPVEVPAPDLPANEMTKLRRAPKLPPLPRDPGLAELGKAQAPQASTAADLSPAPETGVLEAVARAVEHVAERRTFIPAAEIRAVALGHAPGRYRLAEVDDAIDRLVSGGELMETERRGMDRAFVTLRAVQAERRILAFMREGKGKARALANAKTVEERLAGSRLTRGQREAVRTVLLSADRIVGVQGHAGSGKTTMLREARELLGARPILGLAPSAAAARVLGREAGIPSTTLQWFLTRFGDPSSSREGDRAREAYRGAVLAVDECSMIDTMRMRELLRIADSLGVARIALVGDTAQLRAVDAGQPFRLLQKAGMRTATMDEVLRQEDPELREAVLRARYGEPGESIRGLRHDRVREVARDELGDEAARCWLALTPDERADTAVMAPTHEIRRRTNRAIREGLAEEGTLHGGVLRIDRLVNRQLTRALASDIASYEPGDTVVFHRGVYGCRANDVCTVTDKRDGRVILLDPDGEERSFLPSGNAKTYLGLFDTEPIELRAGDRIRWTRNSKAPPTRSGGPAPRPDLVNGGEAAIVGIGRRRVTFRDGDTEFSLARSDPQLRHLDHAYCTTVHAAQGRTATGAIAILDAGGATDQAMFHVEISRVRREFLLLTDDREALIELLEGRGDSDDGALEAIGIDPGSGSGTGPGSESPGTGREQVEAGPAALSSLDAQLFADLDRDWRTLERRAGETNTLSFFLSGYREVMGRAAALDAMGDLTGDLQRLVDRMLAEHRGHLAREREVRALAGRIQDHWRRWPELDWAGEEDAAGEAAGRAAWRAEAAVLAEAAQRRLAARDDEGHAFAATPGGLADAAADLERTRLLDDARRFGHVWGEHRERAAQAGVPELLGEGYAAVAELGARLEAAEMAPGTSPPDRVRGRLGQVDARAEDALADWRGVREEQAALAEAVRSLPDRVADWRASPVSAAIDPSDPADAARAAWRAEGQALEILASAMLSPDDAHAPWVDATPGVREAVARAAGEIAAALDRERRQGLAWLTKAVNREQAETGQEPYYLPRYAETVDAAKALSKQEALPEGTERAVRSWLEYDAEAVELRGAIATWPARADALLEDIPPPDAAREALEKWRERAGPLLDESSAMLAANASHAIHLDRMPGARQAVEAANARLDAAAIGVEYRETRLLMGEARAFAKETGGILYDAPVHGALKARADSLGARGADLPEPVRRAVQAVTSLDARCARDRERVGAFLDAAREVERERRGLDAASDRARGGLGQAGRQPGRDGWEEKAVSVAAEGKAIREEVSPRHLAAHLAFFGAGPDRVAEEEKKIRERIERDKKAREAAEAAQRAAEEARRAEEQRRSRDALMAWVEAVHQRSDLSRELRDCLGEREAAEKAHYLAFHRREEYRDWLSRAGTLLEKADRHLDPGGKPVRGAEDDRQIETLRELAGALRASLRNDRDEIQRTETERVQERSRQQDRSRGRG